MFVTSSFAFFKVSGGKNCHFCPFFTYFDHLIPLKSSLMFFDSKKKWQTLDFIRNMKKIKLVTSLLALFSVSGGKNCYFCPFLTHFDYLIPMNCSKMFLKCSNTPSESGKRCTLSIYRKSFRF